MPATTTAKDSFDSFPDHVKEALRQCAARVLEVLAAEESLLRAHLLAGDLYPELFEMGSLEYKLLVSLIDGLSPAGRDEDARLSPDSAAVAEEASVQVEESIRARVRDDIRALQVAKEARDAFAACMKWQRELEARLLEWGGEPENAAGMAGTFLRPERSADFRVEWHRSAALMRECVAQIEESYSQQMPASGFDSLDRATTGLRRGRIWHVSSPHASDVGRFLRQMAYAAASSGARTGFLSQSITESALTDAFLALAGAPAPERLFAEGVQGQEWIPLAQGASDLAELPLHLSTAATLEPNALRASLQGLSTLATLRVLVLECIETPSWWMHAAGLRWLRDWARQEGWTVVLGAPAPLPPTESRTLVDVELALKRVAVSSSKNMNFLPEIHLNIVRNASGDTGTLLLRHNEKGGLFEVLRPEDEEGAIERAFVREDLEAKALKFTE